MGTRQWILVICVVLLVLAALAVWPGLPVPWLFLLLLAAGAYVAAQI